jgi:hypothetical protein
MWIELATDGDGQVSLASGDVIAEAYCDPNSSGFSIADSQGFMSGRVCGTMVNDAVQGYTLDSAKEYYKNRRLRLFRHDGTADRPNALRRNGVGYMGDGLDNRDGMFNGKHFEPAPAFVVTPYYPRPARILPGNKCFSEPLPLP